MTPTSVTVLRLPRSVLSRQLALGSAQPIRPGDVNWMTAGRGIAHSERTDLALRVRDSRLFGIQSWVTLPKPQEEAVPAFVPHPSATLPTAEEDGMHLRLVAGTGWGLTAPVVTASPLFYADAALSPGAALPLPEGHEERCAYVVQGAVEVAGTRFEAGRMLLFRAGDRLVLRAGPEGARLLMLGGAAMDGPRFIFWNFVSSSRERIEQAKADWEAGRFGKVPGDEHEFIPLPQTRVRTRDATQVSESSPTS